MLSKEVLRGRVGVIKFTKVMVLGKRDDQRVAGLVRFDDKGPSWSECNTGVVGMFEFLDKYDC